MSIVSLCRALVRAHIRQSFEPAVVRLTEKWSVDLESVQTKEVLVKERLVGRRFLAPAKVVPFLSNGLKRTVMKLTEDS